MRRRKDSRSLSSGSASHSGSARVAIPGSMTGFASASGHADAGAASGAWTWELRSVNGKGLDLRLRLPPGFDALDPALRRAAQQRFSRGSIQAGLQFAPDAAAAVPTVNMAALEAVLKAVEELRLRLGSPPSAAETLLSVKGVIETGENHGEPADLEARNGAILAGFEAALDALAQNRRQEGEAIANVLASHVGEIDRLAAAIDADPSRSPEAVRQKIAQQVAPLLQEFSALDPQRLHQEAVLIAARADVREEIDRLRAHCQAARRLLSEGGPVGRKLDFLAQEFNRECNTICSKSNAASVTAHGLEMKAVIDQFREQVQNLE
jgi:uncharacterized protein (TIGR00255 family)